MTTLASQHDLATSKLALGTRLNQAVNDRLNQAPTAPAKPLAGARDVFTRTVGRDAQAGARFLAAPRHVLNHVAGGAQVPGSPTRSEGLLWHTLAATSREVSRAVGGACGVVGTAVGAVGGLVLPAVSRASAEDCVSISRSFSSTGARGANTLLTGVSALLSELVAGASAAITGILAGAGALAGGLIGLPLGALQALGASFRRSGAATLVEECAAAKADGASPRAPHPASVQGADAILTRSGELDGALALDATTL